jgi:hypothetical protein
MSNTQDAAPPAAPASAPVAATSPAATAAPSPSPAVAAAAKTETTAVRRSLVARLFGALAHHAHTVILAIAGLLFLVAMLLVTR